MVSGLVTSPDDQSRICLLDASPIRMASNSLMSIKALLRSSFLFLGLDVRQLLGQRARLCFCFLLGVLRGCHFHVGQVTQRLVRRQRELLTRLVDPLLALLGLLGRRLAGGGAQRA